MSNKNISSLTIGTKSTIREAMKSITKGGRGIVIIVDKNNRLQGVVTDKNIRDALLKNENFNRSIIEIMTTNPVVALEGTPAIDLLNIFLRKGVHQLPIVDKNKKVVDIIILSELKSIPLSSPDITKKEIEVINKVLASSHLSIGPKIKEFEKKLAEFIGVKYAVGINSGTSGLHLCIRSLNIKDGDEVITSPFSFIASANCMLFERAKPVFVDIDENSLCINPDKIEEKITSKTKAILVVHIFGHPSQMDKIMKIAKHHNLKVIEDACEAIGAEFKGQKVGSFGDVGVFAFYPNKQITTAEGGMVVTNNKKIASLCRSMRNQGRDDEDTSWLSHKRLGYNYRMNELSAALGVAQIKRIEEILEKRQRVADLYNQKLSRIKGLIVPQVSPGTKMSWFVYVVRLNPQRFTRKNRNEIIRQLRAKGISSKEYFPPIHLEPFYKAMFGFKPGNFPITEKVSGSTIALPFHNNLKKTEINYISECLAQLIKC